MFARLSVGPMPSPVPSVQVGTIQRRLASPVSLAVSLAVFLSLDGYLWLLVFRLPRPSRSHSSCNTEGCKKPEMLCIEQAFACAPLLLSPLVGRCISFSFWAPRRPCLISHSPVSLSLLRLGAAARSFCCCFRVSVSRGTSRYKGDRHHDSRSSI